VNCRRTGEARGEVKKPIRAVWSREAELSAAIEDEIIAEPTRAELAEIQALVDEGCPMPQSPAQDDPAEVRDRSSRPEPEDDRPRLPAPLSTDRFVKRSDWRAGRVPTQPELGRRGRSAPRSSGLASRSICHRGPGQSLVDALTRPQRPTEKALMTRHANLSMLSGALAEYAPGFAEELRRRVT